MTDESQPVDLRVRLVLLVAVGAAFMSSLDLFVVNVAFDDIGSSLGVGTASGPTTADLSWILNAYAVTYAALLVPLGRLADRYGRRTIFLAGLALFTIASIGCALSGDVWVLVGSRVAQAAGAAAMTPTSLGLLLAVLPPERRASGVRLWAAAGAIAAAIGPSIGGVLTQFGWQWVFLINVPVGVLLLALGVREVREVRPDADAPVPDLAGAVLFAAAVGLLALGLVESPTWGWGSARTLASLALAAVALALFVPRSRRHVAPVIHPELLAVRTFRWATLSMLVFNLAFGVNLLVSILWLQQIWGYSALVTGFAVAAGPAMVPLTVAFAGRFLTRYQPATLISVGSVLMAVGVVVRLVQMGTEPSYAAAFLPGWLLGGIGVGLALPNLMAGATHDLRSDQFATGSGVVTMARQVGFVLGVSILFAVVGDRTGVGALDGFRTTWWICSAVLLLTAATATGMRVRSVPVAVPVSGGRAASTSDSGRAGSASEPSRPASRPAWRPSEPITPLTDAAEGGRVGHTARVSSASGSSQLPPRSSRERRATRSGMCRAVAAVVAVCTTRTPRAVRGMPSRRRRGWAEPWISSTKGRSTVS